MVSESMQVAAKTMKQAQAEMVQWENTLEGLESKVKALIKTRDDLQSTIDKKMSDFELTISFRRQEMAKREEYLAEEKRKVDSAKEELFKATKAMQEERASFAKDKDGIAVGKKVNEDRKAKIDQFVIALQRAYTLVG